MNTRAQDIDITLLEKSRQLGLKIKAIRLRKEWTVSDLAFYSRMSEKSVYNIEAGEGNITLRSIISISVALEISIAELMQFPLHESSNKAPH